eukprot:TRINITY_DN7655_c0_g1_i1.p1 TRINITY_DN7655_c0_g1~~TRINITY_DN7655_c0_g1_i1.p1  ORF type:complete len:309 (-),score=74.03 TRINITY_DN7655_c0_g1_i1:124-981(-)
MDNNQILVSWNYYCDWVCSNLPIIKMLEQFIQSAAWFVPLGDITPAQRYIVASIADSWIVINNFILFERRMNRNSFFANSSLHKCATVLSLIEANQFSIEMRLHEKLKENKIWNIITVFEITKILLRSYLLFNNYFETLVFRKLPNRAQILSSDAIANFRNRKRSTKTLIGELIWIFRSLIYLMLLRKFGFHSWKVFNITFILDLISFYFSNPNSRENEEIKEKKRRLLLLILYILRPPAFGVLKNTNFFKKLVNLANSNRLTGTIVSSIENINYCKYFSFYSGS